MIVTFLDLLTGQRAATDGISVFDLTEGNWSCDCNRQRSFMYDDPCSVCRGSHRFIAVDVRPEKADEHFNPDDVLQEANREYFINLRKRT